MPSMAIMDLAGASLFIMLIATPLMLEKVPKNGFYGFRTRASMEGSEEEWYRLNRIAGCGMFVSGFVSVISCLIVPDFVLNESSAIAICAGVLVISLVAAAVVAALQQR